jgi:hypothetical protein
VPSVRDLSIGGCGSEQEVLLFYCGLVETGPRHRFVRTDLRGPDRAHLGDAVYACVRAILDSRGRMV